MALDITVNVSAPPSGGGDYIADSAILAQRNAMVAAHGIGVDPILGFTGFTDTTGFTTYTATNAEELRTALNASSGVATTKKLITCNWNGDSGFTTGVTIGGPTTGGLGSYVNAGADVGYDTPPHYTKIVAGAGFSPTIAACADFPTYCMELLGFGFVEIVGMGIKKILGLASRNSYVIPPIVAMRDCTVYGTILATSARVLHVENCVFDGADAGMNTGCQALRVWGNEHKNKNLMGDTAQAASYFQTWKATWEPQIWFAGNIVHSMDEAFTDPESHYDWLQACYGEHVVTRLNFLVEFNMASLAAPDTQGFLCNADGGPYSMNMCVHNNIITTSAYWNIVAVDPAGTGTINIYRNHSLRAPLFVGGQGSTAARIALYDAVGQPARTTAAYKVKECYYNELLVNTGMVSSTTTESNRAITNVAGANYVADVFTGNGTWGPNGSGHLTYDDPGQGLSRSAAFTALRNFWMPIGGYQVDGIGATDPNNWPAPGAAWT